MQDHPDHSIIFIHNNKNPNYYSYLQNYKDCILVCGLPKTVENLSYFGIEIDKKYHQIAKQRLSNSI